jgi:surface antigen
MAYAVLSAGDYDVVTVAASWSGNLRGLVMVGSLVRLAAATAFCLLTAACASTPDEDYFGDQHSSHHARHSVQEYSSAAPLQCVPYARDHSGVKIYGDASNWWDKAAGIYGRGNEPTLGSILVLTGYAGPHRSHVAVVTSMVSDREIRVDHANWLNDGAVFTGDPVVDVRPDNDWSQVRVFNERTGTWGIRTYLVQGFIGPGRDSPRVADNS